MTLTMARPWKHPKTGLYWLRKRVPDALRAKVGRREIRRSLGTRDPAEAKLRQAEALALLEKQWQNLRAGPQTLTEQQAHELARIVHDRWLEMHKDNPSEQTDWPIELGENLWASAPAPDRAVTFSELLLLGLDKDTLKRDELKSRCYGTADECLAAHGLVVDKDSRLKLAKAIAAAMQRASLTLARWARGEHLPEIGEAVRTPRGLSTGQVNFGSRPAISFQELINGWAAETRPADKTLYEWRRAFAQLASFLGHDDARRLQTDDLIAWKAALIAAGLRPKTIRDAKFAPVRAILQWAVDNRCLGENPAKRVIIDVKVKPAESKRSFSDAEAKIVLKAALREKNPVRHWVPWLCAYTGARVSEVCQLRAQDVIEEEGIWCVRFTPEAGPLKNVNSERAVPLHPALIERGFLQFANAVGSGPLFADLPPNQFGSRGGNGTKVLGRWVRSLGLTDPRISPNHSWRHRLKTLGRRYALAQDIVDAITGHRRKTVAASYGEFPIEALHREIAKIPAVDLS
jgi:integrase